MPPLSHDPLRDAFWEYVENVRAWGLREMDSRWQKILSQVTPDTSTDDLIRLWQRLRPVMTAIYKIQAAQTMTAADIWMDLTAARDGIPTDYDWQRDWSGRAGQAPSGQPIEQALNSIESAIVWVREHENRSPVPTMQRAEGRLGTFIGTVAHQTARDIGALRVGGFLVDDRPTEGPGGPTRKNKTAFDRWRRIPLPGACDFCLILATRGAVYRTKEAALLTAAGQPYHNHCRCRAQLETNKEHRDIIRISNVDAKRQAVFKTKTRTYVYDLQRMFDLTLVDDAWYSKVGIT
jgi:hypothetical protein